MAKPRRMHEIAGTRAYAAPLSKGRGDLVKTFDKIARILNAPVSSGSDVGTGQEPDEDTLFSENGHERGQI